MSIKYLFIFLIFILSIDLKAQDILPDSLYARGNRALELKDYNAAINFYKEYIKACPDSIYGYGAVGTAYLLNKDLNIAIAYFDTAIAKDSLYARAYSGRGTAYLMKGDPDKAQEDYKKSLKLNPIDISTMISLASLRA